MMPLAGAPLVYRLLERAKRCQSVGEIVLAIPDSVKDDVLQQVAKQIGVICFRGSENDLVERYYQAARQHQAALVVRVPGDNPVIEPAEIDRIVAFHRTADVAFSTNLSPVFANGYPDGIGAEVISFKALEEVWRTETDPRRREHPHLNFLDYHKQLPAQPAKFKVGTIPCPAAYARPDLVLDVNTQEEYDYIKVLYDSLYPWKHEFSITDVIEWHDNVYMNKSTA